VVLIPIVLVALVGAHVLLVRVRGVSHPLPACPARGWAERRAAAAADAADWQGPTRRYDIVKEAAVASMVALVLVVVLAAVLSSPDVPPVTVASWARVAPAGFMATAASELAGTSKTATYGPPYNNVSAHVQTLGPHWQLLAGVRQPINAAETFVLSPLSTLAPTDPALARALATYRTANATRRTAWDKAYLTAVTHVVFRSGMPVVPTAEDGPVPMLISTDERLLEYPDEDDELKLDAVQRLRFYTSALLEWSITPDHVVEDWPDWYQLVPAYVATYGTAALQELEGATEFLGAIEEDDDVSLTEADRVYLKALETWLDMYPEMRITEE
jgi:hypothetical protein